MFRVSKCNTERVKTLQAISLSSSTIGCLKLQYLCFTKACVRLESDIVQTLSGTRGSSEGNVEARAENLNTQKYFGSHYCHDRGHEDNKLQ